MMEFVFRPERAHLSEVTAHGFTVLRTDGLRVPSHEDVAKRYLSAQERRELAELLPRRRRDWLAGRIAAKDAVRRLLFERGHEAVFPVEIAIATGHRGRPVVAGEFGVDVRVSI